MYAQIDSELIEKKARLFEIGKVYTIKKFLVDKSKATYRTVDRDLMIQITQYTTAEVETDPPRTIPHYIYKIAPLPTIRPMQVVFKYIGTLKQHPSLFTTFWFSSDQCCLFLEMSA